MSKREGNPPPPDRAQRPDPPPGPPPAFQRPGPNADPPPARPPAEQPPRMPGDLLAKVIETAPVSGAVEIPDSRSVFERLNAVHQKIEPIKKVRAQDLPYPVRRLEDIYNAITAILAEEGVLMLPHVVDLKTEERPGKKADGSDKLLIYRIVTVDYYVWGLKGDRIEIPIRVVAEAMDGGERATGQAMTSADKTCLLQAFKIPTAGVESNSTDQATAPAGKAEPRQWDRNDLYRYGKQAKGKPLTDGTDDYLFRYAEEITRAFEKGKPWATQPHIDAINQEIERRARAKSAAQADGPEECAGCGGPVESGFCAECGLAAGESVD